MVKPWDLRQRKGSQASSQDLETSKENVDVDNLPHSDDEDNDSDYEVKRSKGSQRVTRQITRNINHEQNGVLSGRDNIDSDNLSNNTESQQSTDDEESSTDTDEKWGGSSRGPVRRSERRRHLTNGTYLEDYSWILGGGSRALGYPRRQTTHDDNSRRRTQDEEEEDDNPRRSGRLVAKSDFSTPLQNGKSEADDNEDTQEDMYSRVKKRRTSFSDGVSLKKTVSRTCRARSLSLSPLTSQKDEEPICRRLRDRNKLTLSRSRTASCGNESSNLKKFLRESMLRKRRRRITSGSSSSSSDSDREHRSPSKKKMKHRFKGSNAPIFASHTQKREYSKKEMLMLMEVQPIAVDPNITFQSVGGLDQFINKLKEIVLFPLLYNEFYVQKGMSAPRGILLHGPPGTGKTLLARALANECSHINGQKVSFFLRKGADLLNKFVGESERQLRLLFQQAALHQPSIIFFDEIDGLAPVRSAKSDQIHNSIVSTLLAELDGLQDRGQIIVLGSTNRLDFVDPALRRPGRFDCELPIFLPSRDGRRDILKVHVSKWKDHVAEELVGELADRCIGFNGADLKMLCWSASINSLRRTYPQIYGSSQKYLLDYESIKVERDDWELALKSVTPSTHRSLFSKYSPAQPLPLFVEPLLVKNRKIAESVLETIFPWKSLTLLTENSIKRCLISANVDSGLDMFIIPALLHIMETLPVHVLSYESLHLDGVSPEFSVTQICMAALKQSGPCVLYIPSLDRLNELLSDSVKEIIIQMIAQSVPKPIMILATVQGANNQSPIQAGDRLMQMFRDRVFRLPQPPRRAILKFFQPVFEKATRVKITRNQNRILEPLPLAPPESPKKKTLSPEELRAIEKNETIVHRELRIFLREMLAKLVRNKKFEEFTKAVDVNEVPDYLEVIDNPMDLETMMCKLNLGLYKSAEQFLGDINLIVNNCLQYNPSKTESDKRVRLRACELRDFAEKLIDVEMDSDFEFECKEIIKAQNDRNATAANETNPTTENQTHSQETSSTPIISHSVVSERCEGGSKTPADLSFCSSQSSQSRPTSATRKKSRKSKSSWSKGTIKKITKKSHLPKIIASKTEVSPQRILSPEPDEIDVESLSPSRPTQNCVSEPESQDEVKEPIPGSSKQNNCDYSGPCKNEKKYIAVFEELLYDTVNVSQEFTVVKLIDLRFQLLELVEKYQPNEDKEPLAQEIRTLLKNTLSNLVVRIPQISI